MEELVIEAEAMGKAAAEQQPRGHVADCRCCKKLREAEAGLKALNEAHESRMKEPGEVPCLCSESCGEFRCWLATFRDEARAEVERLRPNGKLPTKRCRKATNKSGMTGDGG